MATLVMRFKETESLRRGGGRSKRQSEFKDISGRDVKIMGKWVRAENTELERGEEWDRGNISMLHAPHHDERQ